MIGKILNWLKKTKLFFFGKEEPTEKIEYKYGDNTYNVVCKSSATRKDLEKTIKSDLKKRKSGRETQDTIQTVFTFKDNRLYNYRYLADGKNNEKKINKNAEYRVLLLDRY